jgi:hypothetical protein
MKRDGWENADTRGGHLRFGEVEEEEVLTDGLVRMFEFDD